jgi:hypothetical protein
MRPGPVSVRHAVTECQASAAATVPDQQGKQGQAWMATRLARAAGSPIGQTRPIGHLGARLAAGVDRARIKTVSDSLG